MTCPFLRTSHKYIRVNEVFIVLSKLRNGHSAFIIFVIAFHIWFLLDVQSASNKFENLMLIIPLVTASLIIGLGILVGIVREPTSVSGQNNLPKIDRRIPLLMIVLCFYFFGLLFLTFDIATFLFIFFSLIILGERKIWVGILYSIIATAIFVFGLKFMISVPVPTVLD